MSKIKCITFDKEAQSKIPKDIREKMNRDREKALEERLCKNCNGEGGFQFSADPDDGEICTECEGRGTIDIITDNK